MPVCVLSEAKFHPHLNVHEVCVLDAGTGAAPGGSVLAPESRHWIIVCVCVCVCLCVCVPRLPQRCLLLPAPRRAPIWRDRFTFFFFLRTKSSQIEVGPQGLELQLMHCGFCAPCGASADHAEDAGSPSLSGGSDRVCGLHVLITPRTSSPGRPAEPTAQRGPIESKSDKEALRVIINVLLQSPYICGD